MKIKKTAERSGKEFKVVVKVEFSNEEMGRFKDLFFMGDTIGNCPFFSFVVEDREPLIVAKRVKEIEAQIENDYKDLKRHFNMLDSALKWLKGEIDAE